MQPSSILVPLVLLIFLVIALTSAQFLAFLIFCVADNIDSAEKLDFNYFFLFELMLSLMT